MTIVFSSGRNYPSSDKTNIITVLSVDADKTHYYWFSFMIASLRPLVVASQTVVRIEIYDDNHLDYCMGIELRSYDEAVYVRCFVKTSYSSYVLIDPEVKYFVMFEINRTDLTAKVRVLDDDSGTNIISYYYGSCTAYWNAGFSGKIKVFDRSASSQDITFVVSDILCAQMDDDVYLLISPDASDSIINGTVYKWGDFS